MKPSQQAKGPHLRKANDYLPNGHTLTLITIEKKQVTPPLHILAASRYVYIYIE